MTLHIEPGSADHSSHSATVSFFLLDQTRTSTLRREGRRCPSYTWRPGQMRHALFGPLLAGAASAIAASSAWGALCNRAAVQTESRRKEGIPELEAAIRLRPDYASAHYPLAPALLHTGERDRARIEIALEQKYSQEERANFDARLKHVTAFLVTMQ
jgi:hypothetical protein